MAVQSGKQIEYPHKRIPLRFKIHKICKQYSSNFMNSTSLEIMNAKENQKPTECVVLIIKIEMEPCLVGKWNGSVTCSNVRTSGVVITLADIKGLSSTIL